MKAMPASCGLAALAVVLGVVGCAPPSPPLPELDPVLADLALSDIGPRTIIPGTELILVGRGLPSPGDGPISLRIAGTIKTGGGGKHNFEVRLPVEYKSASEGRVLAGGELYAALGATDGTVDGSATLIVESAIDLSTHAAPPVRISWKVARVLQPKLDTVEVAGSDKGTTTSRVHPNDWIVVRGDHLLFGGLEGQTVAVLDGCFLPEGVTESCTSPTGTGGRLLRDVEVPVRPISAIDRRVGVFPFSPNIAGILPGRFVGTVAIKNQQRGFLDGVRSDPRPLNVTQVAPELVGISPPAASLGQYVELKGNGFIGGQPGQATILRLLGQFTLEGSPLSIPVDLEVVVQWLARYPDGPVGRYVLDETDALGQALLPRGGLRQASGTFNGTAGIVLRDGKTSIDSKPVPVKLTLLPVKQLVLVRFLPSYMESLRLFGLRTVDRAVRARVLDVAQRDYAGVNIEFREVAPEAPPPSDFALYTSVDIGGSDPNGLGYLGYDNTPGRDGKNQRLYDRIGGVNAVTQNDGSPGYGGVFAEQLLGFSGHPGNVEKIKVSASDSELFDTIFDPLRPDTGGRPAIASEAAMIPALSDGSLCPVAGDDAPRQAACAILVLGNLIGTTMTHELGHSLGLANPEHQNASYHNNGTLPGRIMNPGGLRSFGERAELSSGPAIFCDTDFAYLQRILPLPPGTPTRAPKERPPCLD